MAMALVHFLTLVYIVMYSGWVDGTITIDIADYCGTTYTIYDGMVKLRIDGESLNIRTMYECSVTFKSSFSLDDLVYRIPKYSNYENAVLSIGSSDLEDAWYSWTSHSQYGMMSLDYPTTMEKFVKVQLKVDRIMFSGQFDITVLVYTDKFDYDDWFDPFYGAITGAVIAGIVVGSLISLAVLIALIAACCCCAKKPGGSHGKTFNRNQVAATTTSSFAVTGQQQPYYQGPSGSEAPPPYSQHPQYSHEALRPGYGVQPAVAGTAPELPSYGLQPNNSGLHPATMPQPETIPSAPFVVQPYAPPGKY